MCDLTLGFWFTWRALQLIQVLLGCLVFLFWLLWTSFLGALFGEFLSLTFVAKKDKIDLDAFNPNLSSPEMLFQALDPSVTWREPQPQGETSDPLCELRPGGAGLRASSSSRRRRRVFCFVFWLVAWLSESKPLISGHP